MHVNRCAAHCGGCRDLGRREFLAAVSTGSAALVGGSFSLARAATPGGLQPQGPAARCVPSIRAGFVRRKDDYGMRWPGAVYDGEAARKKYTEQITAAAKELNVKLDLRPGKDEPSKAVIPVIVVEEKQTGMISMAAAYSELDDFVAMVSVAENNFRGRAERISLDLELFGRSSYDFRFHEPYLDSKDTALDLSVFDTERQRRFVGGAAVTLAEDEFEERRTGLTIALSRPTSDTERLSFRLRTEEVSSSYLQGVRELGGTTIAAVPGEDDEPIMVAAPLHPGGRVNSVTLGWRRDTRDITLNPTRGRYNSLGVEFAGGPLGGENTYQQYRWDERRYWPVRGARDVIALRLLLGTTTGSIPLFDSFSIGGSTTLRGYRQDRYRGENMVLLNAEYRYGLSKNLTVVGFVDVGDAYGGSFRTVVPGFDITADDQDLEYHVGVGVGIRAVTPLGPLRLDFGFGEDGSQTHFGFGHTF